MQFEGLSIRSAADMVYLLEEGRQTEAADEHPWEWFPRFCTAHPEHRGWADEALQTIVEAEFVRGDLRATPTSGDAFWLAEVSQLDGLVSIVIAQFARDLSRWPDEDVASLLNRLLSRHPGDLNDATMDAVALAGKREDAFAPALAVLLEVNVARSALFAAAELPAALAADSNMAAEQAAQGYVEESFAPHRRSVVAAVKAGGAEVLAVFREAVADEADDIENAAVLMPQFDDYAV